MIDAKSEKAQVADADLLKSRLESKLELGERIAAGTNHKDRIAGPEAGSSPSLRSMAGAARLDHTFDDNGALNAVVGTISTGGYGAVGLAVTPDRRFALVSSAEGVGNEDGGRTISV